MKTVRWASLPVLAGGSVLGLLIVGFEIVQYHAPVWYLTILAFPVVILAAMFHQRRVFLGFWLTFIVVHIFLHEVQAKTLSGLDIETLQWVTILLAGWIISVISNERRYSEESNTRRIADLELVHETSQEISSELELNVLLDKIVHRAVKALDATLGELLLFNKETNNLEIVAQSPILQGQIGFKMKLGQGSMGHVALTKQPLIANNYSTFSNALPKEITSGIQASMDVPLLKGAELIGVLGVSRHKKNYPFNNQDLSLLTALASQATIAIQNARLYQEVQHLAFTDVLTGINNRRRLFELAEKEYKRATRYQRPLSLMLMDIDHFKSINDRYGHAVGDAVLKWFAQECSGIIRQKIDVIGRFGGEEFAVLYPETGLASAVEAATRLKRILALSRMALDSGGEIKITVSMGISEVPHTSNDSLDHLVERADKALYTAKQTRNCIAYWGIDQPSPQQIDLK